MSHLFHPDDPTPDANRQLAQLKSIVGGHAFRALRSGRPLKIWRRSTPHNWFIEDARGQGMLWHSQEGAQRRIPNLALFDRSPAQVVDGLREYTLKPELVKIALAGASAGQ